jgi:hypothetical protein
MSESSNAGTVTETQTPPYPHPYLDMSPARLARLADEVRAVSLVLMQEGRESADPMDGPWQVRLWHARDLLRASDVLRSESFERELRAEDAVRGGVWVVTRVKVTGTEGAGSAPVDAPSEPPGVEGTPPASVAPVGDSEPTPAPEDSPL